MRGTVFSIEEFSTFDGPGIRTTVFMKGCPLSCSWCHNPEGQSFSPQFVKSPNGCLNCGACERFVEIVDGKRELTEKSAKACPRNLIRLSGDGYEVEELCARLNKNAVIFNSSGGGVTFSGGEPLSQADFVFACADALKGKINLAIQTCGFANHDIFKKALEKFDYFLYDLKIFDGDLHKKYCGVDNAVIKENYVRLKKSGKPFVTRLPLIPTVTDTKENKLNLARFLSENEVDYIEVLPYNKLAGSKYALTMRTYEPDFDETKEVDLDFTPFESFGIKVKIM